MRKLFAIAILALMCFAGMPASAQQDSSPNRGDWFCPGGGRGYGHMRGRMANVSDDRCPWGRGRGRMANYDPSQCPRGRGPMGMRARSGEPLTRDQAARLLEDYVYRFGSANLKPGDVVEKGGVFEATVVTKEGSPAERLEIDKTTGLFRKVF
ncbi:MAG: hypothetical protein WAW37_15615 [Syntrophobacteraceae bacterium]